MLLNLETLDRESAMALGEGANASAADAWDDESWDDLLAYIEAGSVVPIIGPACYPVEIAVAPRRLTGMSPSVWLGKRHCRWRQLRPAKH
jgi:hypothetical protein